jgi:hypothetical protein
MDFEASSSSEVVWSPFKAVRATLALKLALYCWRFLLMIRLS